MAEFPMCVTPSQRELARLTEEERLTAELKVKERKKAAKTAKMSIPGNAQSLMRHKMWLQHRERVKEAISKVDAEAPTFQAARITGVNNLRDEAVNFMKRTKANIQLLVEISRTMRTHGAINPFRGEEVHAVSAVPVILLNLEKLEQENREFGKRIAEVTSEVDSGLSDRLAAGRNTVQLPPLELPEAAMAKYEAYNIELPESDAELRRLFRPRIYFELYLKDARPLGRIVIQLYTEACPLVVLQLIRSCMCNQHQKFLVKRLFPNLWLEADLELSQDSLLHQPLEYDAKVIDHGESGYVLSFSKAYVKGFLQHLSFAISFKPLNVVNGSRVGFGRIVKGSKICDCIQSYGTKNGKLSRGLVFTSCGLL
ncbi:uncharacterized protein Dana_GF27799 [Drosophila ananassae]|uniref:PPIase cyclophilin-type domain-containing protein n=1 Tax=Drosophila ananassae TaxID=7217 RepID=A0A0P9ACA6_DROAN|nr:uncharacterized protein LOC26515208 [Drosophila ananassae]KPU75760.1 uncharacterized protein Dana_GF27799 [Drosophila ananassae]